MRGPCLRACARIVRRCCGGIRRQMSSAVSASVSGPARRMGRRGTPAFSRTRPSRCRRALVARIVAPSERRPHGPCLGRPRLRSRPASSGLGRRSVPDVVTPLEALDVRLLVHRRPLVCERARLGASARTADDQAARPSRPPLRARRNGHGAGRAARSCRRRALDRSVPAWVCAGRVDHSAQRTLRRRDHGQGAAGVRPEYPRHRHQHGDSDRESGCRNEVDDRASHVSPPSDRHHPKEVSANALRSLMIP